MKILASPQPENSPNLAPSDYHMFKQLGVALHGYWQSNNKEVKDTVHIWLHVQPETLFRDGNGMLVDQSNKCMDYVEKW